MALSKGCEWIGLVPRDCRWPSFLVASLAWLLVSFRWTALVALLVFAFLNVFGCARRPRGAGPAAWALFLVFTLLPVDATLLTAPDGPKLVACCPGGPNYRHYIEAKGHEARGECVICSDVVGGFQPEKWIVW